MCLGFKRHARSGRMEMHEVEFGQFGFISGAALGARGHQEKTAKHKRKLSSISKTSTDMRAKHRSCADSDPGILGSITKLVCLFCLKEEEEK